MITIREATYEDVDFLVEADMVTDGWTPGSEEESAAHREKIAAYTSGANERGWIAEDVETGAKAGVILVRFRDRYNEPDTEANRFLHRFLDDSIFPADGRFCEVFLLWVAPAYRRQGLATRLKKKIEEESRKRGMRMIYTHTEASNEHVVEMNRKLGYQEVRRGPLWDAVPRVSLVKWLE